MPSRDFKINSQSAQLTKLPCEELANLSAMNGEDILRVVRAPSGTMTAAPGETQMRLAQHDAFGKAASPLSESENM